MLEPSSKESFNWRLFTKRKSHGCWGNKWQSWTSCVNRRILTTRFSETMSQKFSIACKICIKWLQPIFRIKTKQLLKCGTVVSYLLTRISYLGAHWINWTAFQSFSWHQTCDQFQIPKKGCLRSGWFGRYKLSASGGMINASPNSRSC